VVNFFVIGTKNDLKKEGWINVTKFTKCGIGLNQQASLI